MPRLTPALDLHVRQAITALRAVIDDLDATDRTDRYLDGVALLANVQDRGLEPVLGYLIEALIGSYDEDDYEDDE